MLRDVSYAGVSVAVVLKSAVTRFGIEGMLRTMPNVHEIASFTSLHEVPAGERYDVMAVLARDLADRTERVAELRGQGTTLLALVDSSNDEDVAKAAGVCADGYIDHQDLNVETLTEVIGQARGGKVPVSTEMARRLLARATTTPQEAPRKPVAALTPREGEVLQLLVEGLSNKQIARRLRISEHGVKRLVGNVLAKLNCPNRTSAVVLAIQERLCEVPDSGLPYAAAQ
ncbi:DNA-binding response regulator [Lentzea sp. NBRC 105346]|uniref:LuxR C-terminal-related transcriptional regulator n=1 Tax=Lentzea sp. NBRC 105346 TaxID=3032205 RepID=UPI0024A49F9C|nr:response regulator transcription factor [Lentzea sp. NBRC 105346]GLZ32268.1 DNA-binding response regulator [Lentzea sp. NBRC 105346]